MRRKLASRINKLAGSALLVSASLVLYILFWLIYPFKPIEFNELPAPVITKEIVPGGKLQYVVDYCKYTDRGSTIYRKLVDGEVRSLVPIETNAEPGCHREIVWAEIPKLLAPGEYHLELAIEYELNPLRTVTYRFVTEHFTVVGE